MPSNDAPSDPLLLGSNTVHFSPSVLMNVDIWDGISAFGGVRQAGDDCPIALRSRSSISLPNRFIQPIIPARSKRASKRSTEVLVRPFLASSSATVHCCGGRLDYRPNIQACVTPSSSYLVSSHITKTKTFERGRIYIRTPIKFGHLADYLEPSIAVDELSDASSSFLLAQEFTEMVYSSLLPCTVSCTVEEIEDLI